MAKRRLTIRLDEDIIREATVLAAKRGISVSDLVKSVICEITADESPGHGASRRER